MSNILNNRNRVRLNGIIGHDDETLLSRMEIGLGPVNERL